VEEGRGGRRWIGWILRRGGGVGWDPAYGGKYEMVN
jgi:hypothetical protein